MNRPGFPSNFIDDPETLIRRARAKLRKTPPSILEDH
jgi:hypothetical protein